MVSWVETYAVEYESRITGAKTRGIYRYVLAEAAVKDAAKAQAEADAAGRPVIVRAVKTGDRRRIRD